MQEQIEKTWLKQVAEGNEPAFRALFDAYKDRFFAVARKMTGSVYIAEEMVQETFIVLWNKRALLKKVEQPDSYLFTIFYRCLYKHFKSEALLRKTRNELLPLVPANTDEAEDPVWLMEERFSQLEAAIATLPPQQATVYRLSKLEGLSREQVAERMGISENTVKNHLAVALQSLRKNAGKLGLWLL